MARPTPSGPAFGLTENNASLLWPAGSTAAGDGGRLEPARRELSALHPNYLRLLVDWAALQPLPGSHADLEARVSGCARATGPCEAYDGIRGELASIAAQQRLARAEGQPAFEVVIDVFGTPAWAARAPSGCELADTHAFSRPLGAGALAAYKALIASLLELGARAGVPLHWWAPWNEPNDPVFISPQRADCAVGSPPASAVVYAQLATAMAQELRSAAGVHHLLLGELNAFQTDSPHRTSIASFIAALPPAVICLSEVWSIHSYAARGASAPALDPVKALEAALDTRGACGREAHVWVTEAGAGAPHPGGPRPVGEADARAGCLALGAQLLAWRGDPRVDAVFQYSFREDPAFPVGLIDASMSHLYPSYRLWLDFTHARTRGVEMSSPTGSCA